MRLSELDVGDAASRYRVYNGASDTKTCWFICITCLRIPTYLTPSHLQQHSLYLYIFFPSENLKSANIIFTCGIFGHHLVYPPSKVKVIVNYIQYSVLCMNSPQTIFLKHCFKSALGTLLFVLHCSIYFQEVTITYLHVTFYYFPPKLILMMFGDTYSKCRIV